MENAANPLDPRFGRCPSSSAAASQRDPHYSTPPLPPRGGYHRRVHSETFLRLPDDFLFDSDHDFSLTDIEFPSISNENGSNSNSSAGGSSFAGTTATAAYKAELEEKEEKKPVSGVHLRSLSLDAAYFEELEFQAVQVGGGGEGGMLDRKVRHRHSRSMDVSTSPLEAESSGPMDFAKKAMPANKLADLALLDPKRAKRILANRQSAARSKERKNRYTSELERKVQTLQTEATTLSAQLTLLQKDTANLAYENTELKLRLQDMEQQAHLRDALNEVLRDDVQRLKIATGQIAAANGNTFNRGIQQLIPHYLPHAQQIHIRDTSQTQQLHVSQPSSCNQPQGGQPSAESMDFM